MSINADKKLFKLVLTAMLIAIVVVFQLLGSFIRFGPFSISLVLVPIVIGAGVCGIWSGACLGLAFGAAVFLSGDASAFLAINPFGTLVTVMLKGLLAGVAAGIVYKLIAGGEEMKGKSATARRWLGAISSAIVCPIVNTGIFLVGCRLFFWDTITEWANGAGFGDNVVGYMFIGLVGLNFLFELLINVLLCPGIVRLLGTINIGNKKVSDFN